MNQERFQWDVTTSPLGPLYCAMSERGLCSLQIGGSADAFVGNLERQGHVERDVTALAPVALQLQDYFARQRTRFDLPLDIARVTPFRQSVLRILCTIPDGTVWTYKEVAQAVGQPRAYRAVGQASAHNPVPIVIPCHRVIASDGGLGGYTGGLELKRKLLQLEGVSLAKL